MKSASDESTGRHFKVVRAFVRSLASHCGESTYYHVGQGRNTMEVEEGTFVVKMM